MKRFRFFLMISIVLFFSSTLWNISEAEPTGKTGTLKLQSDENVWAYNADAPLLTTADQFSSNSSSMDDGSAYENLIDNDKSTIFHSIWNTVMADANTTQAAWQTYLDSRTTAGTAIANGPGYHNLQVKLNNPVSSFFFTYFGRNSEWHDNPNDIVIYATNDDQLGASTLAGESTLWNKITELKDGFPADVFVQTTPYFSPRVDLQSAYKYIRFEVRGTTHMNKVDTRTFAVPDITGVTWNVSEFQMYEAFQTNDPQTILTMLVDSITRMNPTFDAGVDPGCYPADLCTAYTQAFTDANFALSGSDANEQTAAIEKLRSALKAVEAAEIPITEGYYHFVNAYPAYMTSQGVEKGMNAKVTHELGWDNYNRKDPFQLFKVMSLGDGNWSIQNVATGEFINTVDGTSNHVPLTSQQTTAQTFTKYDNCSQWAIANVKNSMDYHTEGHLSGAGKNGFIVTYNGDASSASAWFLRKEADQTLIDSLVKAGPQTLAAQVVTMKIENSLKVCDKVYDYMPMITQASQISSNMQSTGDGSAYANLIDGSTATIFHTIWNRSIMSKSVTEDIWKNYLNTYYGGKDVGFGWHNLQFTLPQAISKMKFTFIGRDDASYHDNPSEIVLYATNDDALGASTLAGDSDKWVKIVDMTQAGYGLPENVRLAQYSSPLIDLGESYKYLRFVVTHTTTEGTLRPFTAPNITGVTFNLSEMQIYDGTPTNTSEYYTVTGMKDAVDQLNAAIQSAREKIANGTVTLQDTAAINSAIETVQSLYIDREALYNDFSAVYDKANKAYSDAMGSKITLITDVSQLGSNTWSKDSGASDLNGALAKLIDGDINTFYQSYWNRTIMTRSDVTAEQWAAELEANGTGCTGIGYGNIQVKLTQPINQFWIEYTGRNANKFTDNPNDIAIYATNDDVLGASVDQADIDKWKLITELTDGFTTTPNIKAYKYQSPVINMEDSYEYIRLVIKNTARRQYSTERPANTPEITGVCWGVSELNLFKGDDPQKIQYNYNPEVKTATDELKVVLDGDKALTKYDFLNADKTKLLQTALDKLLSAYVDTTQFASLYKRYDANIVNSVVGTGIGFVDSQDAITAFRTAIDGAKATVSPTQPTKQNVTNAIITMNDAFTAFMTHVEKILPNTWYNIVSNSTRDFFKGQPVYIKNSSIGAQLSIGNYPTEETNPTSDPVAIWRFVPIEGSSEQFAIQNLATGQYFGAYRGLSAENSPLISHNKAAYCLQYYGNGSFKIQQAGLDDDQNCLKTDQSNGILLNYPLNNDLQQTFKFVAVDPAGILNIKYWKANSINIVTLPFDMKGELSLSTLNPIAKTYEIMSLKQKEDGTGSILKLKEKTDIEAGEPFVMILGDYSTYDGSTLQSLDFAVPENVIDSSTLVVNGLCGTLQGETIKAGMGIFKASALSVSTDNYSIAGLEGYIDPELVTNQEGDGLEITTTGILNSLKTVIAVKNSGYVNVYTLDGKLLKRNVHVSEATKGLRKGIYLIGKQKILVR